MAVGVSLKATLASPKSHILSLQSAFAKIFLGLRSLWNTFAANHWDESRRIKISNQEKDHIGLRSNTQHSMWFMHELENHNPNKEDDYVPKVSLNALASVLTFGMVEYKNNI